MADIRLYFYVEDLNLTAAQRQTLVEAVRAYGRRNADPNPCHRNHWRPRTDNRAVIFEGWFEDSQLTAAHFQNVLANIYGVPAGNITFTVVTNSYGNLVTYTYNSQARLRLGVFGGVSASYSQSQAAARSYIKDNAAAWGET